MITHSANKTGGGENDFQTLLEYFQKRYYIYSITPEGPRVDDIKKVSDQTLVVPARIFPFEGFNIKMYFAYIYYSIKKTFLLIPFLLKNKQNIDVVFVNSSVCIIEMVILWFLSIPFYLSIKEIIEPRFIRTMFYKFFYIAGINVIVISDLLRKLYVEVNKNSKPILIRSSIDEESYMSEKLRLKNLYEHKSDDIITIVNIGVITPSKNQKLLIEALYKLKSNVKIKVIFIGRVVDEKYYNSLNKLINSNNINNAEFIFKGNLSSKDVLKEIYESDFVVITSQKEGMSLVLVESLFMEKPLIATPVGVVPEVIINGFNGFIVDNNPSELALKIENIANDLNLRDFIISNTFQTYKNNFSIDYYKSKHEELLFGDI